MKKSVLLIYFFLMLLCRNVNSQNLIINNSFEDTTHSISETWFDIYNYCKYLSEVPVFTKSKQSVFDSDGFEFFGFAPFDGNRCISIELFVEKTYQSVYIINPLKTLQKGIRYNLSFYITPSDSCGYSTNNIDVLFCDSNYFKKNISCLQPWKVYLDPTISFDISELRKQGQEGKWINLIDSFVATGKENIMVIGNFSDPKKVKYFHKRKIKYRKTNEYRNSLRFSSTYYLDNFTLSL